MKKNFLFIGFAAVAAYLLFFRKKSAATDATAEKLDTATIANENDPTLANADSQIDSRVEAGFIAGNSLSDGSIITGLGVGNNLPTRRTAVDTPPPSLSAPSVSYSAPTSN